MNMKTLYQTLATVMVLLFVVTGLAYGQPQVVGEPQCFTLYAGQSTDAGTVCVETDANDLVVTYTTTGGWVIKEAQLWIGNEMTDLPQTKTGNPIPGQFPFKSGTLIYDVLAPTTVYKFSLPLTNPLINFTCPTDDVIYYMAAHAALQKSSVSGTYQTETGWSAGSPITSKGSWATFSTFTLTCATTTTTEVGCETAFAKLLSSPTPGATSTCFNDLGFQRWGWTNGPLGVGKHTFDIWAGAGQCFTNKGTKVGTLEVIYTDIDGPLSSAKVTFQMTSGNDWFMTETHLYVGPDPLPLFKQGKSLVPTVAPGQYPYMHENLEDPVPVSDTYTVTVPDGPIYVIGHAVTCYPAP